jgi:hypothetical protein
MLVRDRPEGRDLLEAALAPVRPNIGAAPRCSNATRTLVRVLLLCIEEMNGPAVRGGM